MTKHLGIIALGLALTLGLATASWAQGNGAAKQKTNGAAAPAGSYVPPTATSPTGASRRLRGATSGSVAEHAPTRWFGKSQLPR